MKEELKEYDTFDEIFEFDEEALRLYVEEMMSRIAAVLRGEEPTQRTLH